MLTANMKMIAECADKLAHLGEKLFNMTEMKYRAGNKVRIKSLDWYNENKGMNGLVGLFTPSMKKLCGMVVTLDSAYNGKYTAIEEEAKGCYLDDSMIEGLAEKDTLTLSGKEFIASLGNIELPTGSVYVWDLPEGYEFRDENGNVINATKIVLEKKKKEYPKTYEECCFILDIIYNRSIWHGYRSVQLKIFQKLLICRDAYWKIAGEEMGLGKPWEPRWNDGHQKKYIIYNDSGDIKKGGWFFTNAILAFPTEEMRDAFYENFKDLIEECKELL